jgi:rod shape-determining protein MreC
VSERRTGWVLIAILLGQLVLLSIEAPAAGTGGNVLEATVVRLVAPLTRAVASVAGGMTGIGEGWRSRRALVRDNRRLRAEVERLELEGTRLSSVEVQLEGLAASLDYQPPPGGALRLADVVYVDHSSWLKTLLIHVGSGAVAVDQPVIDAAGLVGRVVQVAPPYAKVQLITDRTAAVGAMVRRTRRQGVVRSGTEGLELDFVPLQADVAAGDRVVTSGTDGIYPRGIPVGTVTSVATGDELFHVIAVEPAVDFGVLDRVYLVSLPPLPAELTEEGQGAGP